LENSWTYLEAEGKNIPNEDTPSRYDKSSEFLAFLRETYVPKAPVEINQSKEPTSTKLNEERGGGGKLIAFIYHHGIDITIINNKTPLV